MKPFPLSFPPVDAMISDLEEIGACLNGNQLKLLGKFAVMLLDRSEKANLIGPQEKNRLWKRHFLESVLYGSLVDRHSSLVDIGSGNGFPGIVLAIMGFNMILLEPRRKRHLFLNWVVGELGLDNCLTLPLRLEEFNASNGVKQFVARAVAPPASLLATIEKVAGRGSILVYRQPEISADQDIVNFVELKCPPLDRRGFLVQYRL